MMKQYTGIARLSALVLIAALIFPLLAPALAASYPYDTICMEDVNLRRNPNTTSTILKRLKAGDTVTVLGVSGSFYRIGFDGATGYAMQKYVDGLDPAPDPTPDGSQTLQAPPAVTSYPYDTTVTGKVKFRTTAKTDGEVIRTLPADTVVTVYEVTGNGFAKIQYEGKTGYVLSGYVNLANIPTPTPKPGATPQPGVEKYAVVKKGDSGVAVRQLQEALKELGYLDGAADSKFGPATESALLLCQKRNGFAQDGAASPELQLLIYEGTPKDKRGYRQHVMAVSPVPGATIKENNTGAPVERLQTRLKELGYYSDEISGICSTATVAAIAAFQLKHNLTQDGLATASVQELLYSASALAASAVVTPTPSPTPEPPSRTLRRNDTGDDVLVVQQRLAYLGYYSSALNGKYDDNTIEAVKALQTKAKLNPDGVCGPQTRTVMFGAYAPTAVTTPAPASDAITPENVVIIRLGSSGEAVLRLQTRLEELGYYTSRQDGVYLTDDIAAVRVFQEKNGLTVDGTAGYETQTTLYSASAIPMNTSAATDAPGATTSPETNTTLRLGSTGTAVIMLQNRLIKLMYLSGTADGKYGLSTKTAIIAFQKNNGLTADGVAGAQTQEILNSSNAVANTVSSSVVLKIGSSGDAVVSLQSRLITLGYLDGSADGRFGLQTSLAVMAFQTKNGLKADGIAGSTTLKKLNSVNAIAADGQAAAQTTPGAPDASTVIRAGDVRYANWYTEVKAECRSYPNVTVYDFTTGISWQLNMFSLGAHADSEPLTAEDTAKMNRAFGETTWTPKPVWVIFSDGRIYMASTHNTPHGVQHIRDNDFGGHLCVHFPRTQSQVEAIGSYATSHQKAIDLGWQATQNRAGRE